MDSLLGDTLAEVLEAQAKTLADGENSPEGAWFLRGVIDALVGVRDQCPPKYDRYYTAGWESVTQARHEVGV